ncbi:CLUMA_CG002802, isoform A [Clunio marinus]|uniref:CLUMA_CG002802, isoform A n=1 Tax=Clunio marinus TaxID=568069 RepID=A0A1J1HL04_9DIPT|nr:CLUMA_CG002802, isoform A [Clunio marinus]
MTTCLTSLYRIIFTSFSFALCLGHSEALHNNQSLKAPAEHFFYQLNSYQFELKLFDVQQG